MSARASTGRGACSATKHPTHNLLWDEFSSSVHCGTNLLFARLGGGGPFGTLPQHCLMIAPSPISRLQRHAHTLDESSSLFFLFVCSSPSRLLETALRLFNNVVEVSDEIKYHHFQSINNCAIGIQTSRCFDKRHRILHD